MSLAVRRLLYAGQRGFTPLSLPGLKLWLPPDRGNVYTGNASALAAASSQSLSKTTPGAGLLGAVGSWWRAGWLYLTNTGTRRVLMSTLAVNDGFELEVTAANVLKITAGTGAATASASHGTALSATTWYWAYFYYDGTNIGVSLNNGAAVTQALGAAFSPGTATFFLGADTTPGNFWNGRLAHWWGGDTPLSAADLATIYNAGAGGLDARSVSAATKTSWGAAFAYRLNETGTGTRADDWNGVTLTNNNSVSGAAGPYLYPCVDDDPVRQWNDMSGNGNHAVQLTTTLQPLLKTGIVNGKPVIRFDGIDDTMVTQAVTIPQPYTLAIIGIKAANDLAQDVVFAGGPQAGYYPASNEVYLYGGLFLRKAATVVNTNVLTFVGNGAASEVYVNGGAPTIGDAGSVGYSAQTIILGVAGGGTELAGDIAAPIIYSRALSASELAKLHRYLGQWAGVAVT